MNIITTKLLRNNSKDDILVLRSLSLSYASMEMTDKDVQVDLFSQGKSLVLTLFFANFTDKRYKNKLIYSSSYPIIKY